MKQTTNQAASKAKSKPASTGNKPEGKTMIGTASTATNKPRRQMPKPGSKTQAILTLAATTDATLTQIAAATNSSTALASQVCERYGIQPKRLESFKAHRADILTGYQLKVLKHLNDDKLKDASANNLAYTLAQLNTMERLERNQSTANVASIHADIAALRNVQSGGDERRNE